MTKLIGRLDSFITAMMGDLTRTGMNWARVGVCVLMVGMAMSFSFGLQVHVWHALFLAGVTFVAAFAPEAAYQAFEMRRWFIGVVATFMAAGLLTIQLGIDKSYTAGLRGLNKDETMVQNTKWTGAQKTAKEDETNLGLWQKRLEDLESANGWSATVTADALRARLASANLAIDLEAKRGGCKAKCLERTKERDDIQSKIAIAEERITLTKQIEATKAVLDKARDKAASVEHKSSAVVHATDDIAKTVAWLGFGTFSVSENVKEGTDNGINTAFAFAATLTPAFCFLVVAGLYRRRSGADLSPASLGNRNDEARAYPAAGQPQPGVSLARTTVGERNLAIVKAMLAQPREAQAA